MNREVKLARRAWLKGVGGSLLCAVSPSLPAYCRTTASRARLSPEQFRNQLRGPVLSVPTCFTKDLEVDYQGFRNIIEQAKPAKIRIFALTAGNNQYDVLTREEITKLTTAIIQSAGEEDITIAAAGDWRRDEVLQYAEFAENLGATALQAMKPAEADDDATVEYFGGIAKGTRLPIVLHGKFSDSLLGRLTAIPSIVALKEDVGPAYFINVQRKFGDRLAIFEGGPEYIYLIGYPYGAPASYTTLGTFAPQITSRFWKALAEDDLSEAYRIVQKYEHPFFDRWSHGFWRASLEHFGIAQRYLRPPQQTLSAADMQDVAEFYQNLGL